MDLKDIVCGCGRQIVFGQETRIVCPCGDAWSRDEDYRDVKEEYEMYISPRFECESEEFITKQRLVLWVQIDEGKPFRAMVYLENDDEVRATHRKEDLVIRDGKEERYLTIRRQKGALLYGSIDGGRESVVRLLTKKGEDVITCDALFCSVCLEKVHHNEPYCCVD